MEWHGMHACMAWHGMAWHGMGHLHPLKTDGDAHLHLLKEAGV